MKKLYVGPALRRAGTVSAQTAGTIFSGKTIPATPTTPPTNPT